MSMPDGGGRIERHIVLGWYRVFVLCCVLYRTYVFGLYEYCFIIIYFLSSNQIFLISDGFSYMHVGVCPCQ